MNDTLYIKADQVVRVKMPDVKIGDLGEMWCSNSSVLDRCKVLRLTRMHGCRQIASIIDVVRIIEEHCPGVIVSSVGEQDFVIEYKPSEYHWKIWEYLKFFLIWIVLFFGAAFSIAAFNEDVSVIQIFEAVHTMFTGQERNGITWLEIGYAAGISGGILIFYNHFSKKKEHSDPTPLDIEMRTYEKDLYTTMLSNADRVQRADKRKEGQR